MAERTGAMKLAKLRELMENVPVGGIQGKGIQALIVNSDDVHQSEYLRKRDKRIEFISGFSGSFGVAIITPDKALLWTDGRYYIQALAEFDPPEMWTLMKEDTSVDTQKVDAWFVANLPPKSTVGADANLMSCVKWNEIDRSLTAAGHCLMPLEENLIDKIWGDEQPDTTGNEIIPQPMEFSGCTVAEKVKLCRKAMAKNKAEVLVITALDEVAYILNLRGSDIPFNPVFFAYVILTMNELHLFVDKSKLTDKALQQLTDEGANVIFHPYDDIHSFLKQIASTCGKEERIWINNGSSYSLHLDCGEAAKHIAVTPLYAMKAVKNDVEVQGMKNAHIRDAVALVKYFAWLEDQVLNKKATVTEISGADQLEKFRQEQDHFMGLSFPTISSVGPHGAIIHYRPSEKTDIPITDKELYLCDSGAQYKDGTTDVTRTFHFGNPTAFERECFTRVFKGQCSLSTAVFPSRIKGNYLDTFARESFWRVGLDYPHGTGHGIGSCLNVHEAPFISWKPYPNDPGLRPGMFVSNEPGYYEDEKFGIRLENIEFIVKADTPYNFKDRGFLTFETVTLVPIQTKLLDVSILTDIEIQYLNNYHARVLKTLEPRLQGPENAQALAWLQRETRPISK